MPWVFENGRPVYIERARDMLPISSRKITEIIIHCSATMPHMNIGAKEIDTWHRARGWSGIGYHGVIRRDGKFEQGRDVNVVGAHAVGHNSYSIGICLVGGLGDDNRPAPDFTKAQWATLKRLVNQLQEQYPEAKVIGHRDTGALKACPSFDVATWLETGMVRK